MVCETRSVEPGARYDSVTWATRPVLPAIGVRWTKIMLPPPRRPWPPLCVVRLATNTAGICIDPRRACDDHRCEPTTSPNWYPGPGREAAHQVDVEVVAHADRGEADAELDPARRHREDVGLRRVARGGQAVGQED